MKRLFSALTVVIVLATVTLAQEQVADFNGTWSFKSGKNPNHIATLKIAQTGPAIEVTEVHKPNATRVDRVLTYYSDGRGESNPTSDGKSELSSRTKWAGETLLTLLESFARQPDTINERRDEWTLSTDGQTLTITSTFMFSGPKVDANHNPLGVMMPRNNASPKVHERTDKRVFKKVK